MSNEVVPSTVRRIRRAVLGRSQPVRRIVRSARLAPRDRPSDDAWERFVLFAGHGRSGSTLLAALLSLDPAVVISQELDVLRLSTFPFPRSVLYRAVLGRHRWFLEDRDANWNGYDYGFAGDTLAPRARILGDKRASATSIRLVERPGDLERLRRRIRIPLTFFVTVRNPWDVVATFAQKTGRGLDEGVRRFDLAWRGVENLPSLLTSDDRLVEIVFEDLKADPLATLRPAQEAVGIDPAQHAAAVVAAVDPRERATRRDSRWSRQRWQQVADIVERHPSLHRYRDTADEALDQA